MGHKHWALCYDTVNVYCNTEQRYSTVLNRATLNSYVIHCRRTLTLGYTFKEKI